MGQIARALGQGSEFEFEGKTYVVSPWTYGIQGAFERYLEGEAVRSVKRIKPYLTDAEYKEQLDKVRQEVIDGEYSFGSDRVAKAITQLPHLKNLLYLMLKPAHVDITLDVVQRMIETQLEEVYAVMSETNADPTKAPPPPASEEETPPQISTPLLPSTESLPTS